MTRRSGCQSVAIPFDATSTHGSGVTRDAIPGSKRLLGLVGDIGGTHARFALACAGDDGDVWIEQVEVVASSAYSSLGDAARAYALQRGLTAPLKCAAMAVAGVVVDNRVQMTNNPWCASAETLLKDLGLEHLYLVNDFEAVSRAVPAMRPDTLLRVGSPRIADKWQHGSRIAVIGSGTGLGTGALTLTPTGPLVIPSEGGHTSFAPADAREEGILAVLRRRFGRVSYERLLCAEGLVNIHQSVATLEGREVRNALPAEITQGALGGDPECLQTLERFCAILGTYAGDIALQFCAAGGVYLGGGVLPRIARFLAASGFRQRFEDKGRLAAYTAAIPTAVLMYEHPGLLGAARLLYEARGGNAI